MTETDLRATGELTAIAPGIRHRPYHSTGREQRGALPDDRLRLVGATRAASPTHHADVAQARLFADLLRAEHAELGAAAGLGPHLRPRPCTSEQLRQLQARMKEIRRLLHALEKRFRC
ncbi:hypothetical protein [Mycobacterium arosiense]|uniref:Uncharacterized protein n=1 Tax=Mycobacterium arosiense ATCC BAA-1401 = DSM 45069 TaxID=1265311 RepID=A0A1W9Z994_MYCAI|nr:hypothetical protein [Mycobacterium arosiense]ORA09792.1 hypothetical protein BST14_21470 [Mycobacterium arosiense ATCC BAA-1401 = DSM 45069]